MNENLSGGGITVKFAMSLLVQMALLFVPAGTLNWLEAWLYLIAIHLWAGAVILRFRKNDHELLKTRGTIKKPVKGWDKIIMLGFSILFIALFLIAGFDAVRYQWSQVPILLKAFGFVGFILSLTLNFLVMRENTYLSKIVEVQKDRGHKVITTGPYSYLRHPMYAGFIILFFSLPLALGSLYALIPGALMVIPLITRTYLEDKTLHNELPGYEEYAKKTRYRLIPGVW